MPPDSSQRTWDADRHQSASSLDRERRNRCTAHEYSNVVDETQPCRLSPSCDGPEGPQATNLALVRRGLLSRSHSKVAN